MAIVVHIHCAAQPLARPGNRAMDIYSCAIFGASIVSGDNCLTNMASDVALTHFHIIWVCTYVCVSMYKMMGAINMNLYMDIAYLHIFVP